jgi:hypothetical protein
MSSDPSRAFPKFESYGMSKTAAFHGWKAEDAIEWFLGIGRLDNIDAKAVDRAFLFEPLLWPLSELDLRDQYV